MSETISEFMAEDHNRLDGLFSDYRRLKSKEPARAGELFLAFREGLLRHIAWEEGILFPIFESRMRLPGGPTEVMRREHRSIIDCLDKIKAGPGGAAEEAEAELEAVLCGHNEKEEQVLYPWIDRAASEGERRDVLEKMRAASAPR